VRTVLVVDDVPLMRTMLRRYIAMLGAADAAAARFEILEAANGVEALAALADHTVDVIFLDLVMPEMDGLCFLKKRNTDEELTRIPVVITSALGEKAGVDQAMGLGAQAFIQKPYTLQAVREELTRLVPAPPPPGAEQA
jgi:CheY-like chemotaxis protein